MTTASAKAVAAQQATLVNQALRRSRSHCVPHRQPLLPFAASCLRPPQTIALSHHAGSHSAGKQRENSRRDVLDKCDLNERTTSWLRVIGPENRMNESARSVVIMEAPTVRLVRVTVGDWAPLQRAVEMVVAPRRTVLVGKGGANASLVMQGIVEGARMALHALSDPDKPRHFRCELLSDAGERFSYGYDRRFQGFDDEDDPFPPSVRWEERATRTDEVPVDLWTVRDRRLTFNDGTRVSVPSGTGALALASDTGDNVPVDIRRIRTYLENIRYLSATLARPAESAREDVIFTGRSGVLWTARGLDARLVALGSTVATWFDKSPERYEQVGSLLQRLGGHGALRVQMRNDDAARQADVGPQQQASISFDGVDFGRLSDTQLRRLEFVVALVDPTPTTLFIEEPESIAVPGMIGRLLETIDTRIDQRQIVVATKAPSVVDWVHPDELRLVEGARGRASSVRGLDVAELHDAMTRVKNGGTMSSLFGLA
jgi:hypothetical protein